MNKKLLSLVLSLVMVLGTFTSVFASTETPAKTDDKAETKKAEEVKKIVGKDNKIQYIIDKKFVEGYGNGDYGYDKNIKRSEITKLLVFANGDKELAEKLQGTMKLYKDVDTSYWANGVITVGTTVPSAANGLAMLNGFPNGDFKPEENVTYAQLSKMLVVLTKKDLTADMMKEANKHWAGQWMTWAAQQGILNDVEVKDSSAAATRADAFTMVYNALYTMKNFRMSNTDAKLGVLSALSNNKLTLNQDEKQQYTVTENTVYVQNTVDRKEKSSNVIKVKAIKNPEFLLGALVRVMVNDKNEVTHILELGNPEKGALANKDVTGNVNPNTRWEGVADATATTKWFTAASLNNFVYKDNAIYENATVKTPIANTDLAVINYNSKNTAVDSITVAGVTADVNKDTKIFVANPAQNIMKPVDDIYAALRLIGFTNKAVAVPNVYVGYDTDSRKTATNTYTTTTAKVVVFNLVTKDNLESTTYRVAEAARSTGSFTLEDVDGKVYSQNDFASTAKFPFASFDKMDLVKYAYNPALGTMDWTMVLDASKVEQYPIVEVVAMDNDFIKVKDMLGNTADLNIKDADIFTAKQTLKVGSVVQFRIAKADLNSNANNVSELSIYPKAVALDGVLNQSVVNGVQANKSVTAKLLAVEEGVDKAQYVKVKVYDNTLKDYVVAPKTYKILLNKDFENLKELLKANANSTIRFTLNKDGEAIDFVVVNTEAEADTTLANVVEANEVLADAIKATNNQALELAKGKAIDATNVQEALLAGLLNDAKYAKVTVASVKAVDGQADKYTVVLNLVNANATANTATMTITVAK